MIMNTNDADLELIVIGSGTSSGLPLIECVTAPPDSDKQCKTCISSLTPAGRKNHRRNTGAVLRARSKTGGEDEWSTIVVDCGKTFLASALEWFPKYGLRKIDAVLITHAHADAMNGLDDLRGWTLRGAVQGHIDVYLTANTFAEVKRCFPYLVYKEFASGGGDLPEFDWHIIEWNVPFELCGVSILPFPVHHGRLFTTSTTPPEGIPTPRTPLPKEPSTATVLNGATSQLLAVDLNGQPKHMPYWSLGFLFNNLICWMSDVSHIPDSTWDVLAPRILQETKASVLVLDCLNTKSHPSHFGVKDSVSTVEKIGAAKSYLIGFCHSIPHDAWIHICKSINASDHDVKPSDDLKEFVQRGVDAIGPRETTDSLWLRPSYDGLRIRLRGREVIDDGYI